MARLIGKIPNQKDVDLPICEDKKYFQIGRHLENDLYFEDERVSRFHSTIFEDQGNYYLLDHSLNGTFYNPDSITFGKESRVIEITGTVLFKDIRDTMHESDKLEDIADSKVNKSHRLFKQEQESRRVSPLIDYQPNDFAKPGDVKYLLDMINDPEDVKLLISQAKYLQHEGNIGIATTYGFQCLTFIDK